jgi:hypothetical protein
MNVVEDVPMADPLVEILRTVRERHNKSQEKVEECLGLARGTIRHLEAGRRQLPDFRHSLVMWVKSWEDCVGATRQERRQILEAMSRDILGQFSVLVDDLRPGMLPDDGSSGR